MKLKVYGNVALHFSKNRLLGYVIMYFSMVYAIYHALFVEGAAGGFGSFLHWPTTFSVLAIGLSMTYMKKHTLNDNELGTMLRKDMALSGWILFMLNTVLIGGGMYSEDNK